MSWRTKILSTATVALLSMSAGVQAIAQNAPAALVIGNGSYENYADLRSSAQDAETIASQLIANGYDVSLLMDASAQSMREALSAFMATGDAPEHRLFVYSGHSTNVDGLEFLVPTDASVATGLDLSYNFISLDAVRAQMNRDATPDIIVLDTGYRHFADNELANVLPGATVTDRPAVPADDDKTLTILAIEPGSNNISQANRRNVFADVLATRLSREDQDAVSFFESLAVRVQLESNGRQAAYISRGFTADVVINQSAPAPEPEGPSDREERIWNLIDGSTDVRDYEDYLAFFPEGYYAAEARAMIASLTAPEPEPETPGLAIDPINKPYYVVRLANVRSGPSTDFARMARLPENTIINNLGRVQGLRWFQIVMPDNRVGYIYDTLVAPWDGSELQAWAIAQNTSTIAGYEDYLRAYPQGPNAETARNNILILREQQYQDALAAYSIRPISQEVVVVRLANVRKLPTTQSNVVTTLQGGTRLIATGDVRGATWTRLDYNGTDVFIYDTLIVPYEGSVYQAWAEAVELDSVVGYIRFRSRFPNSQFESEALANIQSLQANQGSGFTPLGEQYVVNRRANVFAEPNGQSDKVLVAKAGEVYEALRMTDNERWVELRISRGEVGYIRGVRVEPYADSVFEAWALAKAEGTLSAYRDFRDAFPGSRFDEEAVAQIDGLLASQNTIQPLNENIVLPSDAFVYSQPDTNSPRLGILPENSVVLATGIGGSPEFYRINTTSGEGYLLSTSAVRYAGSEREAWDNARQAGTVDALNAYLTAHPNGRWLQDAIQLRQSLSPGQQGYQFNLGGLNFRVVPGN
ncbi:MAG: caspase family protein [Alphaproteobacteria bacterium]